MRSTVKELFPDVEIITCSFHISKALREKLIKHFGKKFVEDDRLFAQWYSVFRKFFFAPYVSNPALVDEMKEYVKTLKQMVPEELTEKADRFIEDFNRRYLSEGCFGYKTFDYFKSIQEDYTDVTNNNCETLNHELNTQIDSGTQNLAKMSQIMYDRKVKMVGKLVESCLDERSMTLRSNHFMAKRTLMRNSVDQFAAYSPEQQKRNLIR